MKKRVWKSSCNKRSAINDSASHPAARFSANEPS
jgi:hypothetical protein